MKIGYKNDFVYCLIISLLAILIFYIEYYIFKEGILKDKKKIIEYITIILFAFISFMYFYKSRNNFIVKNIIFIVINIIVLFFGFDVLFVYVFKLMGTYKTAAFFSFDHLKYLLYLSVLILIISIIISSIAYLIKKFIFQKKSK